MLRNIQMNVTVFWVLILCSHRITLMFWKNMPPPSYAPLNFMQRDCEITFKMEAECFSETLLSDVLSLR